LKRVLWKNIATVFRKTIERRYLVPYYSIAPAHNLVFRVVDVALCFLKKSQPKILLKKPDGGCTDRREIF
jgi:hypothetical protein